MYFVAEKEGRHFQNRANLRTVRSENIQRYLHPHFYNKHHDLTKKLATQNDAPHKPNVHFIWQLSKISNKCTSCIGNYRYIE